MKKFLLAALLTTSVMLSQSTTVRGVTLSYDKASHSMTLTIPQNLMQVSDTDSDVKVTIHKQYSLRISVNGANVPTYNQYFSHQGHCYNDMWSFITFTPGNCTEIKRNYVFKFTNVQPNEYILDVSDVCDDKWESNQQSKSIVIQ